VTTINVMDKVAKFINFYDTDSYRKDMDIARRWYVQGYTNQDISTTKEDAENQMKSGKIFCFSSNSAYLSAEVNSRQWGQPIVVCSVMAKPIISTNLLQGGMWAVPRQAKNPERSMMMLNLMHTDKTVANLLVYGVEGTHYVKKGGNTIAFSPQNDPSNPLYYNQIWEFGNQTLLFDLDTDPPNGAKRLDDFNKNAARNDALGFAYDASNMKNEIAVLTNVAAEFDPPISSGTIDARKDGTYQKFLDRLKAGGIDKLLADQNAQLAAWKKANKK
jgi:putative aldouronate transport system substrate-binding protein